MSTARDSLDIGWLRQAYLSGVRRPSAVLEQVLERIARRGDDHVWIERVPRAALEARALELERASPDALPLYGIPFAIKDNIDLAGLPTTAACPDYAYVPRASAAVVQRLLDAGAIAIGKTNLDQFATGLVGTRSPYGACRNPFDPQYISGGSSSGSAVAVAAGLVSFALGTDTAGSGRVPAAFNNLVGLKPSLGLLSTRGVVPACRSLDCVSILGLTVRDAQAVLRVAQGYDGKDPYARPAPQAAARAFGERFRFGVPGKGTLEFFGDRDYERLFGAALERLEALGGERLELDFRPFLDAARLLYEGPWVAERWLVIRELLARKPEAIRPDTRRVIEKAASFSAADAFAAAYRLQALRHEAEAAWAAVELIVTPTAPTVYTLAQVEAEPIVLNSRLGTYTNFVNLFDLAALAVPAGFRADGLPFGVTLLAPAFSDAALCALGERLQRAFGLPLGATGLALPEQQVPRAAAAQRPATVRLVVCGAHMSGLALNRELLERGARLVRACHTAPQYRLFAFEVFAPPRPGLLRAAQGAAIEVEVWEMPEAAFGGFVEGIPAPLGIGTLELEDGERARGFLCEHYATTGAREITHLGGWRAYLSAGRRAAASG
ncbi:MAG TPA: allophanate hydrolase [Burkholderiales bacterium]|nr:allophanate hydrolase [Burkholderiales bacterium]